MPVTTRELISGPIISRRKKRAEFHWMVRGTNDSAEAETELEADIPADFEGLPLDDISVEAHGHMTWLCKVYYAAPGGGRLPPREPGDIVYSFDTRGDTVRRRDAIDSLQHVGFGGTTTDPGLFHGGAINVNEDGDVEGVDVLTPAFGFTLTKYIANADIADAEAAAFACSARMNDEEWRGYAAGEVLFIGAVGGPRSESDYEVTYYFAANQNQQDWEPIPGFTAIVDKRGWDYMWIQHARKADGNRLVTYPVGIHVEQVYHEADFDLLELE